VAASKQPPSTLMTNAKGFKMTFSTTQGNKTLNLTNGSNVNYEIDDNGVQIIEYVLGKPKQAVSISFELLILIHSTGFQKGRYSTNLDKAE
jgi:hypothetical protein